MRPSKRSKQSLKVSSNRKLTRTHAGLVFVRRFQNALAKAHLLPRGSKIIVAVSGGPDSMALFSLLIRLQEKHDFTLHAAHVNYELRGRDSKRDEALVEKVCEENNIPLSVFYPKEKPVKNIEAELRDIRYTLFEKLRKELHFDFVVTAHTMNDLAETFLLNLLRGSGTTGLSPFQRSRAHLVRPFLDFTRPEIETFLQEEHIPSRIDQSNFSKKFTRNRIRHELIPLLESFNPSIVATLAQTAKRLGSTEGKKS